VALPLEDRENAALVISVLTLATTLLVYYFFRKKSWV
jgi:Mg2+ and Co2+ transporter CorA